MGALRVAFEPYEASNCHMEIVEVARSRQVMHLVQNFDALNFDLAETLIHRLHAGIVGGCVVVSGADGGIDRHRGEAVAKRIHSRTRLAFFTAGAAAFGAIALVCCDLPLRRHQLAFLTLADALASRALAVAKAQCLGAQFGGLLQFLQIMSALQIKLGPKPTGNEMNDVKKIVVV